MTCFPSYRPRRGSPALTLLLGLLLAALLPAEVRAQSHYDRQAQNREYQRLQDATRRAYTVPDRPAPSPTYRSSAPSSSGSSPGSSSGSAPNLVPFGNALRQLSNTTSQKATVPRLAPAYTARQETEARERARAEAAAAKAKVEAQRHAALLASAHADGNRARAYEEAIREKYADQVARYQGSTLPNCTFDCQETLTLTDGSGTYRGNTEGGMPQYDGTLTLTTGERLTGLFGRGELSGMVRIDYPDGRVYVGNYRRGAYNGLGKLSWANGDYDEGFFVAGKLGGHGIRVRQGLANRGEWKEGLPVGPRTMGPAAKLTVTLATTLAAKMAAAAQRVAYSNGEVFEGVIADGKRVQGTYTYADGSRFRGTFAPDDENKQQGRHTFTDGHSEEGKWRKGILHHGTYTCPAYEFTGTFYFLGNFAGRVTRPDKTVQHGDFEDRPTIPKQPKNYLHERQPDGQVSERIYRYDPQNAPTILRRPSGEVLTGLSSVQGYRFIGLRVAAAQPVPTPDAQLPAPALLSPALAGPATAPEAVAQTYAGEWIALPEAERPRAEEAARTATADLKWARAAYNERVAWQPALQIQVAP